MVRGSKKLPLFFCNRLRYNKFSSKSVKMVFYFLIVFSLYCHFVTINNLS